MTLDKRSTLILHELVNAEDYVFIKELTKKLNVSRRTIYYDIEKINSWLKEHQLEPVMRSYSKGFYLQKETKPKIFPNLQELRQNQYFYTKEERISLLGVLLILKKGSIQLQDLMNQTGVSRVTTFKDLNVLKQEIKTFKLKVVFNRNRGYSVIGDESNKRKAVSFYLTKLLANKGWNQLSEHIQSALNPKLLSIGDQPLDVAMSQDIEATGLSDFYTLLLKCEDQLDIDLTDEMLHSLALNLLIICKRLEQNVPIHLDHHEKQALRSTPEFIVAQSLANYLREWNDIFLPQDEICFLTIHLLSSKVNALNNEANKTKEMDSLRQVLKYMIFDFQRYSCIFFQNREELEKLIFVHLKPAYYRIKYDVFAENPLTNSIKSHYREVFHITKKVIFHLENLLGKPVNDDETAYIAMYFGGWLRRQKSRPIHRQRAIIVCGTGLGTSNLLRFQLEQLLNTVDIIDSISLREYQKNDYNVDMFFSTVTIQEKSKPVIRVNPILNEMDKSHLLSKINTTSHDEGLNHPTLPLLLDVISKHTKILDENRLIEDLKLLLQRNKVIPKEIFKPMLHELLTEEMIQFKTNIDDWQTAIKVAAQPLLDKGYITSDYIQAMIENVTHLGPYIVIVPNIAIPHARPDQGVNHLGMSMLCLEQPVSFSSKEEHKVQLIFILAAIDNEAHLKALSQLTTLLSNQKMVDNILASSNSIEVTSLLKNLTND